MATVVDFQDVIIATRRALDQQLKRLLELPQPAPSGSPVELIEISAEEYQAALACIHLYLEALKAQNLAAAQLAELL